MDVGVSVAEGCLKESPDMLDLENDSNPSSKPRDWIDGWYSKLHAEPRARDKHLMTSEKFSNEEMEMGSIEEGYELGHDRPGSGSGPESDADRDYPVPSAQGAGGLSLMDLCKSDCCHLHGDYDRTFDYDEEGDDLSDEPAIFDLKGKRFKTYLEDLKNEEVPMFHAPETRPSPPFPGIDALGIMDERIAQMKARSDLGEHCRCSGDEAEEETGPFKEDTELDMDTSLQEYLESNNDIMSHPLYKRLCAAHISLCKLGATDAQLKEMEELSFELESKLPTGVQATESHPELDKFMNEYCDFLEMHKNEFAKPFDEAMEFCKEVDEELANTGLRFLRDKCSIEQNLTNDTISRLQELPLEGEV
ncbi:hypothetical protein AXG93_1154s2080 [Marchantia polymorpha subsp. ruderalis]|uniref:KNOX2 domain-containing protein n=3 Tax=Marchantia polymorpha TaxID=3197 RepID=A0A176WTZ9_MARPO|nr:hypothetical protein AXG93_1154s2080 [Marchantia polymorpha subsp. ruderalis]